jgi:ATP-dependent DNA helicase RecQ
MNSLKEISGRYPNTLEKLKDISGMGPKKITSYGEIIVKIVHEYLAENNKEISWTDRKRKKVIIDGEIRENDQIAILKNLEKMNLI